MATFQVIYDKSFDVEPGFTYIPDSFLSDPNIRGNAEIVLTVYCYYDQKFQRAPTTGELQDRTGFARSTILKIRKELICAGALTASIKDKKLTEFKQRIPFKLRWKIFMRDNFTCQVCKTRENLTVDHRFPEALGGTLDEENLQTLCRSCNSRKGTRIEH